MFTTKNNLTVLIGKSIAITGDTVQITDPTAAGYIADGEIVALDQYGVPLTNTTDITLRPKIRFVQRSGATAATCRLIYSDWIYKNKVTKLTGEQYVAPQEQIYVVGFNGTSGSIDVTTDLLDFMLNIKYTGNIDLWSEQSAIKTYLVPYVTSIKQITVAAEWMKQINNDPSALVSAVALSGATFTASTAATGTATLTNGSRIVSCSGGTPSTDFSAGMYVRIGTTATTTLTLPVYKIESVDDTGNGTITLESPYQGTSGTAATTAFAYASAATAGASDAGLKLTGEALYWELGQFKYLKTRFQLGYKQGMGTTTLTKTQEAKLGNGTYEQVAEMEWFAKGFGGALNRQMNPINPTYGSAQADAVSGATYDVITVDHYDNFDMNSTISESGPQPKQLVIFLVADASQGVTGDTAVQTVLNDYLTVTTNGGNLTPIAITTNTILT